MKITHITATNFEGLRNVDIDLSRPVSVFCGANGAGKSSIADAVSMALTGTPSRVKLKKEYGQLVTDGQKAGVAAVSILQDGDAFDYKMVLPKGQHTAPVDSPELLPYLLDMSTFSRVDADTRRKLLFSLADISVGKSADIRKRLLARKCAPPMIDAVLPLLRVGFEECAKVAANRATETKGAWRSVTGEVWGASKGSTWEAVKPEFNADELTTQQAQLQEIETALATAQTEYGRLSEQHRAQTLAASETAVLEEKVERLDRIATKLKIDQAQVADWQAKVDEASGTGETPDPLLDKIMRPICALLRLSQKSDGVARGGETVPWGRLAEIAELQDCVDDFGIRFGTKDGDPAKLEEAQAALAVVKRAVTNGTRDLLDAEAARQRLAEIAADDSPTVDQSTVDAARNKVGDLQAKAGYLQRNLDHLKRGQIAAAQADQKTADAAKHHADLIEWQKIAEAMAPDGIPGEMLLAALAPINQKLSGRSLMAGWGESGPVRITPDMDLTFDGRLYGLLSESEKWRVDCIVTLLLAELSGLRFAILDRFDVLDLPSRKQLLTMLDELAGAGDLDTVLLCGTLKAAPKLWDDTMEVFWIDHGHIAVAQEERKAA